MSALVGIGGRPYVDLAPFIDTSCFPELDLEIVSGLARVEVSYTGGSLKWMNVVAPWVHEDPYVDYMLAIKRFSKGELKAFVALAEDPSVFDPEKLHEYRFGDETDHPLSHRQMLYLKYRYGVYFPWKACYHLLENDRWEDKHSGEGKGFVPEALEVFPQTVRFIQTLPFLEIGRAVIFGIEANDHAPAHRDSEPGQSLEIAQSISFDPRANKRFFLQSPDGAETVDVTTPLYWFNDMDYHGVHAAPFFRYSVRVDGVFEPSFKKRVLGNRPRENTPAQAR
jgi:hypothetical protein